VSTRAVLGELPALPLHEAGKYVAAAYVVLFALVLIYVAIMAVRLGRFQRELGELSELAQRSRGELAAASEEATAAGVGRAQTGAAPDAEDVGRPRSAAAGAPLGAPSSGGAT
jgi:hypothetical protein